MSNVSLEAAQALQDMGYPQGRKYAVLGHYHPDELPPVRVCGCMDFRPGTDGYDPNAVAAPDELDALRCCARLGYRVDARLGKHETYWVSWALGDATTNGDYTVWEVEADDITTLITAIAAHHAQHAADAGKGE